MPNILLYRQVFLNYVNVRYLNKYCSYVHTFRYSAPSILLLGSQRYHHISFYF